MAASAHGTALSLMDGTCAGATAARGSGAPKTSSVAAGCAHVRARVRVRHLWRFDCPFKTPPVQTHRRH